MFILHHRQVVLDISGYNCLAMINKSKKNFEISKIEADVSFPMEISILSCPVEAVEIPKPREGEEKPVRDITEQVKSNIIGKKVKTSAIFHAHPEVDESKTKKITSVQLEKGIPINMVDELTLKSGQALIVRAKPAEVNNVVNITINYTE